ncbi:MAG: outer membrane beta-barrel protein [Deltaproteobacteria bacterium]|nr:outer membrane beta-barrel protein [Deltaproteobacteria bacterium]
METLGKATIGSAMKAFRRGVVVATSLATTAVLVPAAWAGDPSNTEMVKEFQNMKSEIRALQQKTNTLELRNAEKDSQIKSLEGQVQKTNEDLTGMSAYNFVKDVEVSGYVSTIFTDTLTNPSDQTRRLGVFETNSHSFNNSAFKLVFEKPTSNESRAGFRVDILSGETGRLLGNATSDVPTGSTGLDDFELEQAYVTYKADLGDGLDIYAGKFVTLLGAEVIESPLNYNISRSILFGFAIPFTHTGIRATYPLTDKISVTAGVNNGWDNNDDLNHGYSYEGQVAWSPNDDFSLSVNGIWGPEQVGIERRKRGVVDVVANWTPTDKLTLIGNFDWGHESGVTVTHENIIYVTEPDPNAVPPFSSNMITAVDQSYNSKTVADWYGGALVANYQFTDRFGLAGRAEYFVDADGSRTGLSQDLWEFSVTPAFWVTPKLLARLEFRTDHSSDKYFLQGSQPANHQETVFGEVAYLFP